MSVISNMFITINKKMLIAMTWAGLKQRNLTQYTEIQLII